jgi:hypothetical protein
MVYKHNKFLKLADYFFNKKAYAKATFFRNRKLLKQPLKNLNVIFWVKSKNDLALAKKLALYAPLDAQDLSSPEKKILNRWRSLPQDPKFFKHILKQWELSKLFSEKSFLEFLMSPEGLAWYKSRSKLKRAPYFELDQIYKSSKQSALHREIFVRSLIRKFPLLTYTDLKSIAPKNLQLIWERFPQRELHRKRFLTSLLKRLGDEAKNQRDEKDEKTSTPTEK